MARPQRIEYEGAVYHGTARGSERRVIFLDDADRQRFLRTLRESVERFEVRLYLFCLMSNHIHLVIETPRANLGRFMHRLQTAYTVYFNRRHRRCGHLVQGRYGARLVEKDAYLLRLSRYVHLNPVFTAVARRRPVRKRIAMLREYRWSSYRSYIGRDRPLSFVDYDPILASVTVAPSRPEQEYRRFVESGIETIDASFLEVRHASALCVGSEAFCDQVRMLYHRRPDGTSRQGDVAFRRLGPVLSAETIVAAVCRHLEVERGALLRRRRNSFDRAIAARMLCDNGVLTQRQVAEMLGIGTGSPISQQVRKLTGELESDRAPQKQVSAIAAELRRYTRNANA